MVGCAAEVSLDGYYFGSSTIAMKSKEDGEESSFMPSLWCDSVVCRTRNELTKARARD